MDLPVGVLERREAEMATGRAAFEERNGKSAEHTKRLLKEHEEMIKEEEARVAELNSTPSLGDRAARDRAGAELIDQAQTMLEAVGHNADREVTIVTRFQQTEIEKLEGPADPAKATAMATDHVTAQAVNQPTVLASEQGTPTEDRPLNLTDFRDSELSPATPVPADKFVPKTRRKAETVSRQKVPSADAIVKPDFEADALRIAMRAPDEALAPSKE